MMTRATPLPSQPSMVVRSRECCCRAARNFDGAENALDRRSIHRLAGKRAVEIDQMQIFKALPLKRLRLRRRVAVEPRSRAHVTLLQAHARPSLRSMAGNSITAQGLRLRGVVTAI